MQQAITFYVHYMIRLLSRITRLASEACTCKELTTVFPSCNISTIAEIGGAMFISGENKIKYIQRQRDTSIVCVQLVNGGCDLHLPNI
jgi:hypothetical protein